MYTITRKPKKESDSDANHNSVKQATGWQMQVSAKIWCPPTDMYELDETYIIRVEIAGMGGEDFAVSVDGDTLVVSGSRPDVHERCAYHQMEIRSGKFTSTVILPNPIDLENASAEYEDGFFIVILPKLESSKNVVQEE